MDLNEMSKSDAEGRLTEILRQSNDTNEATNNMVAVGVDKRNIYISGMINGNSLDATVVVWHPQGLIVRRCTL